MNVYNDEKYIYIPIFWGRAIQLPPVPYFSIYSLSLASSSEDHGPFFTFVLSQHGALPIFFLELFCLVCWCSCIYISPFALSLSQDRRRYMCLWLIGWNCTREDSGFIVGMKIWELMWYLINKPKRNKAKRKSYTLLGFGAHIWISSFLLLAT